ncbi:MAG TPA: alanine racemase [Thermoanaerobaculia bacterium]
MSADAAFRSRPTRAVIDLSALVRNYRRLRERAGRIAVFPVVKSDAYGHGAVPVARRLEEEGADRFAVASAEEGVALRRGGVRGQILILGYSDPRDAAVWRNYGLIPSLYDIAQARAIAAAVGSSVRQPVHLKLDTGMGRLGASPGEIADFVALLRRSPGLELTGTFTQLARAQEPSSPATDRQIETMRGCLAALSAGGLDPGLVHVANSAAVLLHPSSLFQAFRPGLALYGVLPSEEIDPDGWEPVMTVETAAMSVRRVPSGMPLGYGGTFVTQRASTIAVLPIGYDDGLRRSLSGRVFVLLRGREAPLVGAVSMNLTLVDATDCGAEIGDRVVVLGSDSGHRVTAWHLARAAGTIPYEILCGFGGRLPRRYI